MTLVAGFKAEGISVLLGDFVLSSSGQRSGLRKKVHKVSPNCAMAWTGALIAANQVFRSLREHFDRTELIKRGTLEAVLTGFNASDFGSLHVVIIGWIVDGGAHCFRWRSDWPQEIFYAESAYEGSGQNIVQRWCGSTGIHDASDPTKIDINLAIDECLAIATNLMSIEILESGNLSELTFGHAYEILYLAADEFQYVSNVLYLAATIEFDDKMTTRNQELTGPIYKYRALGEYSVIDKFNPANRQIDCHVIGPTGIDGSKEANEVLESNLSDYKLRNNKFPVASDYYCVFLTFVAPGFISPPFSIIQPPNIAAGLKFIDVDDDGNLLFHFRDAQLEWMYKTVRADQEGRSQTK